MAKFKRGDRVRVLPGHNMGQFGASDGAIGVVNEYGSDCPFVVLPGCSHDIAFMEKHLEPAPLFAVGDKVRCVEAQSDEELGLTGTVLEASESPVYVTVDFGGDFDGHGESGHCWNFFDPSSQLVAVAASNDNLAVSEGKFKVGDRVRALESSGGGSVEKGDVYTVTELIGDDIRFRKEDGSIDGWDSKNFEPAPLTIKTGLYYKTRDGRKVGPASKMHGGAMYPMCNWEVGGVLYQDDGTFAEGHIGSPHDLISEWQDEPAAKTSLKSLKTGWLTTLSTRPPQSKPH